MVVENHQVYFDDNSKLLCNQYDYNGEGTFLLAVFLTSMIGSPVEGRQLPSLGEPIKSFFFPLFCLPYSVHYGARIRKGLENSTRLFDPCKTS
jgi:hypothetical protein